MPWVRTRLRTAPAAACALALLVALTACLAAAFPRAVDRYEDAGLRRAVERTRPDATGVSVYAGQPDPLPSQPVLEEALRPGPLAAQYARLLPAVPRPLSVDRGRSTYGVRTAEGRPVPDPWLPRPSGIPAKIEIAAQQGLAAHATVRSGRLPRADGPVTAATPSVEAAVSVATAKSLRIKVGSVIHFPGAGRGPLVVRVTGVVAPRDPEGAYWSGHLLLRTPSLITVPDTERDKYWLGALLIAPEAAPALLGTPADPVRYWQLAPATEHLHSYELGRLRSAVASLKGGPAMQEMRSVTDPSTDVSTGLDDVLTAYAGLRSGVRPLVAVAAFGTGTVAAVVLLMAGGLAADRRRAELALLRARGASLRGLTGRLFAETAVVALPAGALGLTAALLALPGNRLLYATAAATAVTLAACAALPLRAAAAHRVVRVHGARADVASARPSRRRTVVELTLVVVTLAAVETLRRRGTSGDQLTSLAPVLVGVAAALLLVRLYPLPLRGLARPAARLRGAVGHLSLARAGRTSASAVLPLLALLTALTTAAFGGSVLAGVAQARDHAALLLVGADARVESSAPLPSGLADRVRRIPGVRTLATLSITYQARPNDETQSLRLVGVDPGDYAELARQTGLGAFAPGELRRASADGALPAVASPCGRVAVRRPDPAGASGGRQHGPRPRRHRPRQHSGRQRRGLPGRGPRRPGREGGPPDRTAADRLLGGRCRAAPSGGSARGRPSALRGTGPVRRLPPPVRRGTRLHGRRGRGRGLRRPRPSALPPARRPGASGPARPAAHHGPDPRAGPPPSGPGVPAPGRTGGRRGRVDGLGDDPSALPGRGPDDDRTGLGPDPGR